MSITDETVSTNTAPAKFTLAQQTRNGAARAHALQELQNQQPATTTVVEYRSQGRLVIIGPADQAIPVAEQLLDRLTAVAIVDPTSAAQSLALDDRIPLIHAGVDQVEGHLGAFQVRLTDRSKQSLPLQSVLNRSWNRIDLILDLQDTPCFDAQISPPGYFATRGDSEKLARHVQELPELIGEFEKPRFFHYDPSICVHDRNHKTACTRCIDACPTLAIRSIGEQIQVDPYLCQGGGSCAAVCPSGAIQYVYPTLADLLGRVRQLLKDYRQAQGEHPRLLFFKAEHGDRVYAQLATLDETLLPLALDDVGAIDLAVMLNSLAYGAQQVIVLLDEDTPARVHTATQQQQDLANRFLDGMGYPDPYIVLADMAALPRLPDVPGPLAAAASYGSFSEKRAMIRLALEHLYKHAAKQPGILPLSAQAPFGEISVDPQACTLCLACTGVCPTRALLAGTDVPQVNFIEDHCVQCGLCEQTCPENAIRRHPRYLFDEEQRRSRRVLHAEAPFLCISCGKPFATQAMIERMQEKLAGHWMFGKEREMQRLKMCEDCRIRDLWDEQGA